MTRNGSPVEKLFELQRQTIEQTGDLLEAVLEETEEAGEMTQTVAVQRDINEQLLDVARQTTQESVTAIEPLVGTAGLEDIETLRETIDATFDSLEDQHAETFDSLEDRSDRVGEDARDQLDRQVEYLLELNETVESQLRETVERLLEESEDGLPGQFEAQLGELLDQLERQADSVTHLEDQFESIDVNAPEE